MPTKNSVALGCLVSLPKTVDANIVFRQQFKIRKEDMIAKKKNRAETVIPVLKSLHCEDKPR